MGGIASKGSKSFSGSLSYPSVKVVQAPSIAHFFLFGHFSKPDPVLQGRATQDFATPKILNGNFRSNILAQQNPAQFFAENFTRKGSSLTEKLVNLNKTILLSLGGILF